jgi:Restriction Enzyme Adenine Methylase Associated
MAGTSAPRAFTVEGRRVTILDLIDAGLLQADEEVEFVRPRLGQRHSATILANGSFQLNHGAVQRSPALAAMRAADLVSYDGWHA